MKIFDMINEYRHCKLNENSLIAVKKVTR